MLTSGWLDGWLWMMDGWGAQDEVSTIYRVCSYNGGGLHRTELNLLPARVPSIPRAIPTPPFLLLGNLEIILSGYIGSTLYPAGGADGGDMQGACGGPENRK